MIIPGNLRYTLTFKELTSTKDAYGAITTSYKDKYVLKAEKIKSSGKKTIDNEEIFNTNSLQFRLYNKPITSNMQVIFKGDKYKIMNIDNNEFQNEMLIEIELINE